MKTTKMSPKIAVQWVVWGLIMIFFVAMTTAVVKAQEEPPPAPQTNEPQLQATIDAQERRIADLEGQWEGLAEENRFALDQAIFNFITRPALLVGVILAGLGILLLWRSTGDIGGRLTRLETGGQRSLDQLRNEQAQHLLTAEQKMIGLMQEQINQIQETTAGNERVLAQEIAQLRRASQAVDGQLLRRAQQLLERVLIPIHLPRGYNLGHVYQRLQLSGFENLCWYDNLGERPMAGITLILIRSADDASRFRSLISRLSPPPEPRRTAFILYVSQPNTRIAGEDDLQIDFPNIALAHSPLEIATQALTMSWGLQPSGNLGHGSNDF